MVVAETKKERNGDGSVRWWCGVGGKREMVWCRWKEREGIL